MPKQKKAHYKEDVPVKIYLKSEISEINVEKSNFIQLPAICLIRAVQRHEIQSQIKRIFFFKYFMPRISSDQRRKDLKYTVCLNIKISCQKNCHFSKFDLPTSNSIFSAPKWSKCKIPGSIRFRIS